MPPAPSQRSSGFFKFLEYFIITACSLQRLEELAKGFGVQFRYETINVVRASAN
jgi:hypothetical protein